MRLLIVVGLVFVAVCGSAGAQPSCTVPPLTHWLDVPAGPGGWHLEVSAGGGPAQRLQVDTGSVGLAMWTDHIGKRLQPPVNPPNSGYIFYNSSHRKLCGKWVSVPVDLSDGQGTTVSIPSMNVLAVDFICESSTLDAPCASCAAANKRTCLPGLGMLGVGFDRQPGMGTPNENAFLQIPGMIDGKIQRGYMITLEGITLGLPQDLTGFTMLPLQKAQPPELWQQARGCVTATGAAVVNPSNKACGELLVDTGVDTMFLSYSSAAFPFDPSKTAGFTLWPPAGNPPTVVTVTWPDTGAPQYTYTAHASMAELPVNPHHAFTHVSTTLAQGDQIFANTSRQLIYQSDYLYDATCGRLGFRNRPATGAAAARGFVTTVGEVGLFEIAAGQLAITKSANPGVQAYGYLMVTNHTELGEELKRIAARLGYPFPGSMGPANEAMLQTLKGLSGAAFDQEYLSHMVTGHTQAVAAFEMESAAIPESALTLWAARSLPIIEEHLILAKALQGSSK